MNRRDLLKAMGLATVTPLSVVVPPNIDLSDAVPVTDYAELWDGDGNPVWPVDGFMSRNEVRAYEEKYPGTGWNGGYE